jgi:hypothetical protein
MEYFEYEEKRYKILLVQCSFFSHHTMNLISEIHYYVRGMNIFLLLNG